MKRILVIFLISMLAIPLAAETIHSEKMSTSLKANIDFPLPSGHAIVQAAGFGGSLQVLAPVTSLYPLCINGNAGYSYQGMQIENSLSLAYLALGAGAAYDLTNQVQLIAGAGIGAYASFLNKPAVDPVSGDVYPNQSAAALYWEAGLSANIFLTPMISLGIHGSYSDYVGLFPVIRAGVFFTLNVDGFAPRVEVEAPELPTIYPSLSYTYDNDGIGNVRIVNNERFPLKAASLTYRIEGLMPEPVTCGTFSTILPGTSRDVTLVTALGTAGLMHQNDESLSSTINLKYELGGTNRAITLNSTIDVLHRNALVWDDDTKAASFIDTRNDAVLSFAKAVAHTVQTDDRRAVNRNLRVAMAMFEAMGVYRISYVQDPHRPTYRDSRNNTSVVDYIQYPNQSLFYRGGDCDDLTILFCSLVESVGVETAMLTVPGHIYTAVNLATPASQVDSLFADPGLIIIHNDECWLPIEITLVGSSFQEAWETGAREWNEAAAAGKAMIYPVGEASKRWLNIGSPTEIVVADELAEETFAELYRTRLDAHVAVQLSTLTGPLTTRLESNPDDMRTLNKLGIAYASHGLLEQAEECFSEAVDNGYKPALANLGNVHLLNGKYRQAVNDFNQVLEERPNSSVAIAGLARASSQAGERLKVEKYLAQLDDIDQGMAVQLAVLSTSGNEDRAAELSVNSFMYWAGEEE